MTIMNPNSVLSFAIQPLTDWDSSSSIIPVIDERDLVDWIAEYERWHGFHMRGSYGGLRPGDYDVRPAEEYLMWDKAHGTPRERYLLGCSCGTAGCWPLFATISLVDGLVTWDKFRQPFRPRQDYSSFGPFVFDVDQYVHAVREVLSRFRRG
ncbi:MAG: hypothetical protein ABSF53_14870 [Terracidiphilus sp.]|jgi:hypothetical protein